MDAVMTFLSMEDAGVYVWPPYLLTLILMLGLWLWSWRMMRRREREAGCLSKNAILHTEAAEAEISSS